MPDHFRERAQENLLAAFQYDRVPTRLLWSSVALCLSWIYTLSNREKSAYCGKKIAILNLDIADISISVLELRDKKHDGQKYLIPKRDLPENGTSVHWPMVPFDLCWAVEVMDQLEIPIEKPAIWQMATGGSIAALLNPIEKLPEAARWLETSAGWCQLDLSFNRVADAVANALFPPEREMLSKIRDEIVMTLLGFNASKLSKLYESVRNALHLETEEDAKPNFLFPLLKHNVVKWLSKHRVDAVVVVGPLAKIPMGEKSVLAKRIADLLQSFLVNKIPVVIAGHNVSAAHGCAIYGYRELTGKPTYLDTLPRFCIIGKNRLRWEDVRYPLVSGGECEGGKEYRPTPEELKRLKNAAKILANERCVRFRISREQQKKQIIQEFDPPPQKDCLLSFDVRMRPAQGFAQVTIIPEIADLFGEGKLFLNWDKMEEGDNDSDYPPDYPVCAPIEPCYSVHATDVVQNYCYAVSNENWEAARKYLDKLGTVLQSGKALGSDPEDFKVRGLIVALKKHYVHEPFLSHSENLLKDFIRAATSLYSKTPSWAILKLENYFRNERKTSDPNPEPVFVHAAGRCFSSQPRVKLFVECFDIHFRKRIERYEKTGRTPGMNNWCKAFQLILRLHDEAVQAFSRERADSLAFSIRCLLEIEKPILNGKLRHPFKNGMFSIYFLLRFRARTDGADFLTDHEDRGTDAYVIRILLQRLLREKTLAYQDKQTIASTLKFLQSEATEHDVVIMKDAHDQFIGEKDQDEDD